MFSWNAPEIGGEYILTLTTLKDGVAVGPTLMKTFVVPTLTVTEVSVNASSAVKIDTRAGKGTIATDHAEDITYSNLWAGDADATATVAVNGEVVKTDVGEGVYRWPLPGKGGNYVFTHTTARDGAQAGETLTATFVVASREIEIDDGTDGSGGKDSRFSYSGVYDGRGHGISVEVTSVENPKIAYSIAKEGLYVESLLLTNACDATAVWYTVSASGYNTYTNWATITIYPKTLTEEMCVADEDAAWFFDGTEKKPAVTVVDGDPNIATADDYTLAYSGRTGAGLFPVTVTGTNNYCGVVTKEFAILKRPVAPPAIGALAYNGRVRKPTVPEDSRWEVVSNPGGTEAGAYTNVVLRLTAPEDYRWKGLDGDAAEWVGVFEIRPGSNGWSVAPGQDGWTEGETPPEPRLGRPRYGSVTELLYRARDAAIETATANRPTRAGLYTVRFVVVETKNYRGTYADVDFEISRADGGTATTTTPVSVPYAWLEDYVGTFGAGDWETTAHAMGANGITLWESYVAGLDPEDETSKFKALISLGEDGLPVVTWSPDLSGAEAPRTYTTYGKPTLDASEWIPVTDENRAAMRFFKVTVEIR